MALIKCPECNREVSDTVDSCIHCGYKLGANNLKENLGAKEILNSNNVKKNVIHGHAESELIKDFPIMIYEDNNLVTELKRLGTFEFDVDRDRTLIFKYKKYKPASYTFKKDQAEEIFLSLDMIWGKIRVISNLDGELNDIQSNNNANISVQGNSGIRNIGLIVGSVILGILIFFAVFSDGGGNPPNSALTQAFEYAYSDVSNVSCRYNTTKDNMKYYDCSFRHLTGNVFNKQYSTDYGCAACLYYDNNWTCTGALGSCSNYN